MKNEILENGFEPTDYRNTNLIATLWAVIIALCLSLIVSVCILATTNIHIDAYNERIQQLDSANCELQATNEMLNNNLINK